ncbi:olfactory receptor 13G1-like [Tachyglossus aculeatus]|uniref:olfactory receptor 13G1-like n=1 Tax=Tachyglossus aculeatus TaxID=9261 RepID=UPI0018F5EE63|nr:olfactory receptor 13G1-like [Tachyglossus aculeatus]
MNLGTVSKFVILGQSNRPELRPLLFAIFLYVYLVPVLGNGLIMAAVSLSAALRTPIYLLLLTLALVDVLCTSPVVFKMLETTLGCRKTINYGGCIVQLFFFTWSLGAEMVPFTAMAYDRYVAICFPLLYAAIMSRQTCSALLATVLLIAVTNAWSTWAAILRIRMAKGKRKAFSTCSSHLFYSPVIYTYIQPASSSSFDRRDPSGPNVCLSNFRRAPLTS